MTQLTCNLPGNAFDKLNRPWTLTKNSYLFWNKFLPIIVITIWFQLNHILFEILVTNFLARLIQVWVGNSSWTEEYPVIRIACFSVGDGYSSSILIIIFLNIYLKGVPDLFKRGLLKKAFFWDIFGQWGFFFILVVSPRIIKATVYSTLAIAFYTFIALVGSLFYFRISRKIKEKRLI